MKSLRYILLMAVTMLTMGASAKTEKTNVYMFGFSASFKDSVVYVTDIQNVEGVWIDSKTKFLQDRDEYSYQLKTYLTEKKQHQDRICMVFYYLKKKKAEKEFLKLMKKYKKGYDVRHLSATEFKFDAIEGEQEKE